MNKNLIKRALASNDPQRQALARNYLQIVEGEPARKRFKQFVKLFWPQVAPNPLRDGWYLDAICEHLQHLTEIKRLLINIPPRHGKSLLTAVLFPAWLWISQPQTKYLCSSYSLKDLSIRDSIACRSVIESPLYQRHFGHRYKLSIDQNTKNRFATDKLGFRLATSTESGNTGEGCDVLVADDLNNVTRVNSSAERQAVIRWWCQVMSTRMNPGGLDAKVVIQQRCHQEDITGYILSQEGHWTQLILPWEFDPRRKTVTNLWTDPREKPGEPLSDLYTPEQISELQGGGGLGPTGFATQFNQTPSAEGGNVFKEHWFNRYQETPDAFVLDGVEVKKLHCRVFITTDLAISLKTSADWTVAQVWVITPHQHLLLLHQWRERVEGPDTVKQFTKLVSDYRPDALWVEDVAFQRLMIQMLRQKKLPVKALNPQGQDKLARSQRAQVLAECGQVWLPENKLWVNDFLDEVTTFPGAAHDDQVDCLAWAGLIAAKYPVRQLEPVLTDAEVSERLLAKERAMMWGED